MKLPHPLQVALATQRLAALALLGQDPVEHELGGDRGVVLARQPERRASGHPRVAGHGVLDRRPLGVAEVERPGDVGRGLDDHEGRLRPVGPTARAVGGEDVGRQPAPVDAGLDAGRVEGLRHRLAPRRPVGHAGLLRPEGPLRPQKSNAPLVQRTNGVVVPPAGSVAAPAGHPGRERAAALSARYRAPPVTTRERPSRAPAAAGSQPMTRGLCRPSGALLLSVTAVRPGV